jgi:ElaB/YqjD/DUF883 family membrane-anchored ribosome-binding protein
LEILLRHIDQAIAGRRDGAGRQARRETMQEQRNEYTTGGESTGATERSWDSTERRAEEAASELGRKARRVKDDASETLRSAREKVEVAYDRTADQATRMYRNAREYAVANPGVAAAVTFAAGVGVGMMVSGRNGSRIYRQGLIPVVAVALAQAVLDVFDEAR